MRRRLAVAFPSAINDAQLPTAIGEVRHIAPHAFAAECRNFAAAV